MKHVLPLFGLSIVCSLAFHLHAATLDGINLGPM